MRTKTQINKFFGELKNNNKQAQNQHIKSAIQESLDNASY